MVGTIVPLFAFCLFSPCGYYCPFWHSTLNPNQSSNPPATCYRYHWCDTLTQEYDLVLSRRSALGPSLYF